MLPKVQHYVPQFILRNFCSNEKEQIYVFDKKTEKVFSTNIKNVAAENGFYNFKKGETTFSIEHKLSALEAGAAEIISKIILDQSLSKITKSEKATLSIFIAAQFSRTKQKRLLLKQMDDAIIKHIKKLGGDPNNIKGFKPFSDNNEIDEFAITTLEKEIEDFWQLFYDRSWILFKSTDSLKYYISDNPITLHNENDYGVMGSLGLAVKGIEIYFPISPTLSLGIYDESNQEIIKTHYKTLRNLKPHNLKSLGIDNNQKQLAKDLMHGLENGELVKSLKENVEFQNSMQVAHSSRFVYSINGNFDLAQNLIIANPNFKEPPQIIQVN